LERFASCIPRVQLYVNACNGWPQFALQHHWLLPINCHFLRLYSAASRGIAAVSSAIEESALYLLPLTMSKQRSTLLPKTATMSNEFCVEISSFRQSRTLIRHCWPKRQYCRSNRQQSCLLLRHCCWCGPGFSFSSFVSPQQIA